MLAPIPVPVPWSVFEWAQTTSAEVLAGPRFVAFFSAWQQGADASGRLTFWLGDLEKRVVAPLADDRDLFRRLHATAVSLLRQPEMRQDPVDAFTLAIAWHALSRGLITRMNTEERGQARIPGAQANDHAAAWALEAVNRHHGTRLQTA